MVAQAWLGGQALVVAAQAGLPGTPAVRSKVQLAAGQPLQACRRLQLPILAAGLDPPTGQAPAPVTLVQLAIQAEVEFELRAVQRQGQGLLANVAFSVGLQGPQCRVTQVNAAGLEFDHATLGVVQPGIQVQLLQAVFRLGQPLALQCQRTLRGLQGTGDVQPALDLALQSWPQLAQARQVQVDPPGQALLQAATAIDAVTPELDCQRAQGPALPCPLGLDLEHCRLAAQAAFQVKLGIQAQGIAFHFAFAAQRPRQGTRQLGQPIGWVERRQLQVDIPCQGVCKAHGDTTGSLALPGTQRQLRQLHLTQVTFERAGQAERAGRAIQVAIECALVVAIAITHLGQEPLEGDFGRRLKWIQAQPREVLPVQLGVGDQTLLPVSRGLQLDPLGIAGVQVQGIEPGTFAVDQPGQQHSDRRLLGRQAGRPRQLIALEQVAPGVELELVELHGVGQRGGRLEGRGTDLQGRRQVLGQRLQLPAQRSVEVTAAGACEFQGFLQLAGGGQRQLPRFAVYRGQLQLRLELHRPVGFGLQVALQAQLQVIALQVQAIDAQPGIGPVRLQFQVAKQVIAIHAQLANLDLAQFDGQRQAQGRQLQRAAVDRFGAGCKGHVDTLRQQLVNAQGRAQQTCRRPGQQWCLYLYHAAGIVPSQPAGLPATGQAALEVSHLKPGHLAQHPAAAGLGPQQQAERQAQAYGSP